MAAKHPWMKFFPADWRSDEKLGMCSLAARGLWMEMLALMHRAEPYGHLLVNGKKPNDEQLASLARAPADQIRALAHELEEAGVLSRTRNGTIYSRRMTRDEKRRNDGEVSAITGGLVPGSRRHKATGNKGEKSPPPRVADGVVCEPPTHPEARGQKERSPTPKPRKVTSLDDVDMQSLEAWAQIEAPNADVIREMTKAQIWTRSKERTHRDATAFMQKWLMKASDEAGPAQASAPATKHPVDALPKDSIVVRAIDRAHKRYDDTKATEIYRTAAASMAEAERLAAAYLEQAA